MSLSHPHLRALLTDAEGVRAAAKELRDSLSEAQLTWRPAPSVWSVADCFEHLRKIDKSYSQRMQEAVERMEAGEADYTPGFIARHFIRYISPDAPRKLRAPKAIQPGDGSAEAEALDRFLDQQAEVRALIEAADGRDLNTGRFASPLFGLLKFSVGEGLTLLVRHEQRHTAQARRVTELPDFPLS